ILCFGVSVIGCFVAKEKNINTDYSSEGSFIRDTLNLGEVDSLQLIYTYKIINQQKVLISVIRRKKIDVWGQENKEFRPIQETYYTDDGQFKSFFNVKDIKYDHKLDAVKYDQDKFTLDKRTGELKSFV